ncbi:hypothetical protein A8C56_03665 [Niabella ginsenosidivorans]|uniref:TfoX N-terminal domain-containing protein n=1 Tax=Niabella ginsenosidivorans TaxID=1176587 RepID=A0A1A9HXT7_9BACT|nr:TfoX/Sxy family protein [Niabella ginsenosidivorans]ANH80197.1 hypothetical protein A8C56_03665 [Niabella ginsenosidivorans]
MAYNERIADKIRQALAPITQVKEQKMFGGLAFMVNGKMCITIGNDQVMCRIDPAMRDQLLRQKDCRTVIMGGREYKGYLGDQWRMYQ